MVLAVCFASCENYDKRETKTMDKVENEPGHLSSGNEYAYGGYGPGHYEKRRATGRRCSRACPKGTKCSCSQRHCFCKWII